MPSTLFPFSPSTSFSSLARRKQRPFPDVFLPWLYLREDGSETNAFASALAARSVIPSRSRRSPSPEGGKRSRLPFFRPKQSRRSFSSAGPRPAGGLSFVRGQTPGRGGEGRGGAGRSQAASREPRGEEGRARAPWRREAAGGGSVKREVAPLRGAERSGGGRRSPVGPGLPPMLAPGPRREVPWERVPPGGEGRELSLPTSPPPGPAASEVGRHDPPSPSSSCCPCPPLRAGAASPSENTETARPSPQKTVKTREPRGPPCSQRFPGGGTEVFVG